MERVKVCLGNYEAEVDEHFMESLYRVKDFAECWCDTLDQLRDILIYVGSLENGGIDVDYKNYIILLGSIRDIKKDLQDVGLINIEKTK